MYTKELRPRKFSDVIGQEKNVNMAKAWLSSENPPDAYLFKGASGGGKTSMVQIMAMSLNCKELTPEGDPCCKCPSCLSVIEEKFDRGIQRLDGGASSKKGVVDLSNKSAIRSLVGDKNNIFIIEEVDRLSDSAKDSLLKTLEEVTPNTYWFILSMKPSGLNQALSSRCKVLSFYPMKKKDILLGLKATLERAGVWSKIGTRLIPKTFFDVLATIAGSCKGNFRQALQDTETALQGHLYTIQDVLGVLDVVDTHSVQDALKRLLERSITGVESVRQIGVEDFLRASYDILTEFAIVQAGGELDDESLGEFVAYLKTLNPNVVEGLTRTITSCINSHDNPHLLNLTLNHLVHYTKIDFKEGN